MSNRIRYNLCPVCSSSNIKQVLQVKDHSVSGEIFELWECAVCSLRFTQNVPPANEIGRYYQSGAYVSHTDTKKGLVNRLYHIVRNITLQSKRKMIIRESGKQTGDLLDIGAGTGAFASTMQQAGWNVTALEPDATARENALKNHQLLLKTLDELFLQKEEAFDLITLWHVLEHVHLLHQYIEHFAKILKPDGVLIAAVPNYNSSDASKYGANWAAYDVPRHLWHFSALSMQTLMQQHGFTIQKMLPMWFDSFYVSMLSEQYKNGHPGLISAFRNGLVSNMKAWSDAAKCSSVIYIIKKQQKQQPVAES